MIHIDDKLNSKIRNMSIVCALMVVVMHCRPQLEMGTFAWWIKQFMEYEVTYIAVPFFFLLSGFLLAGKYGSGVSFLDNTHKREIRKRIKSLLVPYFVWMITWFVFTRSISCISAMLHGVDVGNPIPTSIGGWLYAFGLCPFGLTNLTVLWYVRDLMVLVLISPLLFGCLRKFGFHSLILIFGFYSFLFPWPERVFKAGGYVDGLFWNGVFSLVGIFWFVLGMAIRDEIVRFERRKFYRYAALMFAILFIAMRAICVYYGNQLYKVFGFLSVPFTMYFVWDIMPSKQWVSWLCTNAFPVYLIHKFVLTIISIVMSFWTLPMLAGYFLRAAMASVLSVIIAVGMRKWTPRISSVAFGGR